MKPMRRTLFAAVLSALAAPATASAAITHVYAQLGKPVFCVEDSTVAQLTFQVKDSTGQLIESASATPVSAACPGGSGTTSFIPSLKTGYPRFPFGATITVLGDGAALDIRMPVAAWDALTSTTRLKNLPAGSSVSGEGVNTTVPPAGSMTISTSSPDALTIGEALNGGVPFTAVISPRQFAATITAVRNAAAGITFGGPAFAGFKPYTFRLAAKLRFRNGGSGVVTGTTYPHAQVLVIHSEISLVPILRTVADGRGRFRVSVPDVRRGDLVDVAAVQPGGHGNWITTTSAAGTLHPRMQGPADRARVSGIVRYTVKGIPGSATWTLYLPGGGAHHHHGRSFTLSANTLANGVYRVEVVGTGISMIDYRYLIVHH
jgi:hypothetical protein